MAMLTGFSPDPLDEELADEPVLALLPLSLLPHAASDVPSTSTPATTGRTRRARSRSVVSLIDIPSSSSLAPRGTPHRITQRSAPSGLSGDRMPGERARLVPTRTPLARVRPVRVRRRAAGPSP